MSLASAKEHAYINDTGDATYDAQQNIIIQGLIGAAVARFERETGKQIRVTGFTATIDRQNWEYSDTYGYYDFWLRDIPLVAVSKIYYVNDDASEDTLDSSKYAVDTKAGKVIASELPESTGTIADMGGFNIDYTAGLAAQLTGTLNADVAADATSVTVKTLSADPDSQRGILTMVNATTGARESIVFTAWTESASVYTFTTAVTVAAFSENDVVYVISPPEDVQTAIYQIVAHWYEHREAVGNEELMRVPMAADAIIQKYRIRRL